MPYISLFSATMEVIRCHFHLKSLKLKYKKEIFLKTRAVTLQISIFYKNLIIISKIGLFGCSWQMITKKCCSFICKLVTFKYAYLKTNSKQYI